LVARDAEVAGAGRYQWGTMTGRLPAIRVPRLSRLLPTQSELGGPSREEVLRELAVMSTEDARDLIARTLAELIANVLQMPAVRSPASPGAQARRRSASSAPARRAQAPRLPGSRNEPPPRSQSSRGGTPMNSASRDSSLSGLSTSASYDRLAR